MSLRVTVLRGGPGELYQQSLESGKTVLAHLPEAWQGLDVFIDRSGLWHRLGVPVRPEQIFRHSDLVFNTASDDGEISQILEHHQIPFVGPGSMGFKLAQHKRLAKNFLRSEGLKAPYGIEVTRSEPVEELAKEIFGRVSGPWILKPLKGNLASGLMFARNVPDLEFSLNLLFENYERVLVEEYIRGAEAAVYLIEGFRGEPLYVLPPVEIHERIFSSKVLRQSPSQIVPARFSAGEKERLIEASRKVFRSLGLRHYGQVDLILHPSGQVYVLEVNAQPRFDEQSGFRMALEAVGARFSHFLEHVVGLARRG